MQVQVCYRRINKLRENEMDSHERKGPAARSNRHRPGQLEGRQRKAGEVCANDGRLKLMISAL
jgi:hypothetical protein